ncbi:hypothetical protein AB0305_04055 [Arthrobacter sp. NPDC080086]|uniref:hypothetical protein n=1 Tax=Arthrobacter sp. NPDC080086 TaxID=3155917 RepID=UPI00344B13F1
MGQYLKRTDPSFLSKAFGFAALSDTIRAYPELTSKQESGTGLWVNLRAAGERASPGQTSDSL